jgi:LysM repeat protein
MAAIESGDSFQKIGRKYHISSDLVALLNPDVNPRKLRVGAGIKVVQGPFNLKVVRSDGRLDLYARDLYVRSYAVHFEDGAFMPAGMYKVRAGGKVVTRNAAGAVLERVEITGADEQTQQVRVATLYASPTMRTPASGGMVAGMQVAEGDLGQLFAALLEGESWVKVEE